MIGDAKVNSDGPIEMDEILQRQLLFAATFGDLNMIRKCLREGADVNALVPTGSLPGFGKCKRTALHRAVFSKRYSTCAFLLENGADPNRLSIAPYPYPPVYVASSKRIAQLLLDHGAIVEHPATKYSVLRVAVETEHFDLFKYLLGRGADPNGTAYGKSMADLSADYGLDHFVEELARRGVTPSV